MNELVDPTCAILIAPTRTEKQNFALRNIIDVQSFERAIEKVLEMPLDKRKELGAVARHKYVQDRERFQIFLIGQVQRLADLAS